MSSSKVIPGLAPNAWRRWDAPRVVTDPGAIQEPPSPKLPTEQELEALRQSAFEEGFASGRTQGIESGRAEIETHARLFRNLAAALARPFDELDRRLEDELVALAIAVVRQLVRREIRTDPEVVVAAVRESLRALPDSSQDVRILLHPEDAALVRRLFADDQREASWKIAENPGLSRGGCKVVTSTSQVDATVEHRLTSIINSVFGGERSKDRSGDAAAERDQASPDREDM